MIPPLRRYCLLLLLGLLPCNLTSAADGTAATTVETERSEGWTRTTVSVPGRLVSYALPRNVDGTREIALLVEPKTPATIAENSTGDDEETDEQERLPACPAEDDTKPDLLLLRLARVDGALPVTVRENLPHDLTALDAADLDADGTDELLLAREEELFVVTPTGERRVVKDPGLVWSSLHPRATEQPQLDGRPLVPTTPLGELVLFGAGESAEEWVRLASVEIPVKGAAGKHSLTLFNPRPRFVGARKDGTLIFATRPERFGKQRLQVSLVLISPDGEATVTDCWTRLPEPEDVIESKFLIVDRKAMLLVTTKPSFKLSLFGEKRLRLFPLELDRSRLGKPAVYVAESRMNMWQEADVRLLDVNDDGLRDLVIAFWKGLKDDRVVLDAYLRKEDGWFATSPKSTGFDVNPAKRRTSPDDKARRPDPDRSFTSYGRDLDGDGLPDLLLQSPAGLLVYRGRATKNGERLVETKPLEIPFVTESEIGNQYLGIHMDGLEIWTLGNPGEPRLADLDGAGASEVLIVTRAAGGISALLQVVGLATALPQVPAS